MNLQDVNKNPKPVPKEVQQKPLPSVMIDNVKVIFNNDPEEDFTKVTCLDDVLLLDAKKPGIVNRMIPPLHHNYLGGVNRSINSHVNRDDNVYYKQAKFAKTEEDGKSLTKVVALELGNLVSMSVIVARLENGDYPVLTNLLKRE